MSISYKAKRNTGIPVYKQLYSLQKEYYKPIILFSHVSKIFERNMYKKKTKYMEKKVRNFMTSFK